MCSSHFANYIKIVFLFFNQIMMNVTTNDIFSFTA